MHRSAKNVSVRAQSPWSSSSSDARSSSLSASSSSFNPYQFNGGLVAAVAGPDFCVIASDTRLSSGYEILDRYHVSSRLWTATGMPPTTALVKRKTTRNNKENEHSTILSFSIPTPPVLIASAGCNADCEALKRVIRADWRAAEYFGECSGTHGSLGASPRVSQVATLLSHLLYLRRSFPFYSFCVVAGMEDHDDPDDTVYYLDDDVDKRSDPRGETRQGCGRVYVYDAIGSYERVAVATAGMGRELLQPILDRQFRTLVMEDDDDDNDDDRDQADSGKHTSSSSSPSDSKTDKDDVQTDNEAHTTPFGSLRTTSRRTIPVVSCTKDEAVTILRDAYRAVSEREIGVGDQVVIWTLQRHHHRGGVETNKKEQQQRRRAYEYQIIRFPLKKH